MRVDLHMHTTASDGCWDPADVVREVKAAGIELFAVADHESVGSVLATEKLAREAGLKFIRAVEITSVWDDHILHILGYGVDPENAKLVTFLNENQRKMREMNIRQMEQLIREHDLPFTIEEFLEYDFDRKRGGAHVTNYLVDSGMFQNFKEALKFVVVNCEWVSPDYLAPDEVCKIIKNAGGHPVLAHPGSSMLTKAPTDEKLDQIIAMGIEGLECYSNYHSPELIQRFVDFCKKRDLIITAGSDCHGPILKARRLGYPRAELKDLNLEGIWPTI